MKLMLKILAGLCLLLLIVVAASFYYLDNIVKQAVVQIGPEVTDTQVELDSVNLSLLAGRAELKGLAIGNPEGFDGQDIFSLKKLLFKI